MWVGLKAHNLTKTEYSLSNIIVNKIYMSKQVIIITGASSGIGKASAKQLIKEGHIVYCGARRVEKMKELEELGAKVMPLDVTDTNSIKTFVDKVITDQGRLDVLFNNAGYGLYGAMEDIETERAREQFEVNLFGLANITKAVLPTMRAQKSGKIINTSSIGGKIYTPLGSWYHATKHALEGWSDCLRLEVKKFGIDVVIIEPGLIQTEFTDVMSKQLRESSKNGTGSYTKVTDKLVKASAGNWAGASPASVIADVVSKAVNSKKPKTRYAAGKYSFLTLFARRFFSDRFFDKMIMGMIK